MSETRPDPDALLERVKRDEAQAKRGRLKVFFGAAPGVGKTYAMLEAARVQQKGGVDVVIGWVETHKRAETAALAELCLADESLEWTPERERLLVTLLEHEVQHHGQLIRYVYANGLSFPASWSERYTV